MFLLVIVLILVVVWVISAKNNFTRLEMKVTESLSGIEVALTKRYDTLTKMLDVAKGYTKHEKEVFTEVVNLRKGMSIAEMNEAAQKMDTMLRSVRVTAEAYPQLQSSQIFMELQRSIYDVEEHLQAARRLYNANVTAYNTAIAVFPNKLLAGGRTPKEVFEAESYKREDVKMSF